MGLPSILLVKILNFFAAVAVFIIAGLFYRFIGENVTNISFSDDFLYPKYCIKLINAPNVLLFLQELNHTTKITAIGS